MIYKRRKPFSWMYKRQDLAACAFGLLYKRPILAAGDFFGIPGFQNPAAGAFFWDSKCQTLAAGAFFWIPAFLNPAAGFLWISSIKPRSQELWTWGVKNQRQLFRPG